MQRRLLLTCGALLVLILSPHDWTSAQGRSAIRVSAASSASKSSPVLRAKGSGPHTTQTFMVPHMWDLQWSYLCSKQKKPGIFRVFTYRDNGHRLSVQPVIQRGIRGHGTEYYHRGGSLYLVIKSDCNWSVNVLRPVLAGAPQPTRTPPPTSRPADTPTPASVPTPSPAPTLAPTPAPVPTRAAVALLDIQGTGQQTTQTFTTPGTEWTIAWAYNCAAFGSQGNFIINIYTDAGGFVLGGVNELGESGSRVEYHHGGGSFYLEINSECAWHVIVYG